MSDVNTLLTKRLDKKEKSQKMVQMAERSASGQLSGFAGIFNPIELSGGERDFLEAILYEFGDKKSNITEDLNALIAITAEVKTINNQAAILHGERIQKARQVLKNYKEGAFSNWLLATYGNRQTPYNFLCYYEFYQAMPKILRPQIEAMPKQAIYTLASRQGSLEKKRQIVEEYKGEPKTVVLSLIRELFPLSSDDKRKENFASHLIDLLSRLIDKAAAPSAIVATPHKRSIIKLLNKLGNEIQNCRTK